MPEIGSTLRAARMSAHIDVSEIEAQTKIRAKYLRALENEEWDLLPGPTFVRSFLRTYAQALDLDAKALVEEYRLNYERPSEAALEPIVSTPSTSPRGRGPSRPSRGYMALIGIIGVVIVLLVIGLLSQGGGGSTPTTSTTAVVVHHHTPHAHGTSSAHTAHAAGATSKIVALSLRPSATVYVCLIDNDNGSKLIPGLELQPGTSTQTFHAKRFTITLGNSSVTMFVDGIRRAVAPSSTAIGYSVTKAGRQRLTTSQMPTCT
jgi:cytoskeleton protein RodZ